MRNATVSISFLILVLFAWPARAQEHGTPDEAKAMTERAALYLKANGPEKAFKAITEGSEGLKDRDLYVFVYNSAGICQAHGGNAGLVGKNLLELKDFSGYPVIQNIVAVKDTGWVDYVWKNPVSAKIENKHAYIKRVGDYVLGVGSYVVQQ